MQAGVEADAAIYNSIMRQQAAAGSGPAALEGTLADMEAHGVQPDRRSLFLLLREHSRRGDLASAMTIMRRMAQLGRGPNPSLPCCTDPCLALRCSNWLGKAVIESHLLACVRTPNMCEFSALHAAMSWAEARGCGLQILRRTASHTMRCWKRTQQPRTWRESRGSTKPCSPGAFAQTSAPLLPSSR